MEKFFYGKILVALRIKKIKRGSIPITNPHESVQLVTLKHAKGVYLKAHIHIAKKRATDKLQECLVVRKGKIKIDLYSPRKHFFKHVFLKTGDVLLLLNGGYGIHLLKDSELIEIKNGPFIEDKVLI